MFLHICSGVFVLICIVFVYCMYCIDFSFMSVSWASTEGSILREDASTVPVKHFPPQRESLCHRESVLISKDCFSGPRGVVHTIERAQRATLTLKFYLANIYTSRRKKSTNRTFVQVTWCSSRTTASQPCLKTSHHALIDALGAGKNKIKSLRGTIQMFLT